MRLPIRSLAGLTALALALAACGGGAAPASPSVAPQPSPDTSTYWLRASTFQAIPPANLFGIAPSALITGDGTWITQGPIPAIYPGPLLPNLVGRTVSADAATRVLAEAQRLGLLGERTEFLDGPALPGGVTGRIELTVDGERRTLTGDPGAVMQCITTPCDPEPGSAQAFADFWARLQNPESWLTEGLGAQEPYVADRYALLIGPAPVPDPALPGASAPLDWPLDDPVATFGEPVGNNQFRCGVVEGDDAAAFRPLFEGANQLSQWVEDPSMSATFGVTVRPFVPGEDPCAETFGAG
ncbi:MAG TPA: hypothetical protein VFY23_02310 [Candidatus Limnocylindrales bacterium]|nr:hypothetical protein [Candidatus Limnocylindrales bacterium]